MLHTNFEHNNASYMLKQHKFF